MTTKHTLRTPSFAAGVLVTLLVTLTAFTLLHWHKDWTDQGCQLCHVRDLPNLHVVADVVYRISVASQPHWNFEFSADELESCIRTTSGRSPPAPISFTL